MVREINLTRFSADGECYLLSIDCIFQSIFKIMLPIEKVKKLTTIGKTLQFLKNQNFNFIIVVKWQSFLSPLSWLRFIFFRKHFSFGEKYRRQKNKLLLENMEFGIIYKSTPGKFYNIKNEFWTHCISGIKSKNKEFYIFDPLYDVLKKENYNIMSQISEVELEKTSGLKLLLWA